MTRPRLFWTAAGVIAFAAAVTALPSCDEWASGLGERVGEREAGQRELAEYEIRARRDLEAYNARKRREHCEKIGCDPV